MGLTVLKKKTGYRLGLSFCIIGIIIMLVVFWKWLDVGVFSSPNILSEISSSFFKEYSDISFGIGITLFHYTLLAVILLIVGLAILILRRERIGVTESVTVVLECQFCGNRWTESMSKLHLKSMGYPGVRTLSRRKCSGCGKFIRPKMVSTR